MSTSLYYFDRGGNKRFFGKSLKYEISQLLWQHDGSLSDDEYVTENYVYWDALKKKDVNFGELITKLSKRRDDVGEEASILLRAMKRQGCVRISLES